MAYHVTYRHDTQTTDRHLVYSPIFCITFVFHLSWVLQFFPRRYRENCLCKTLGGGGANKVPGDVQMANVYVI